VNHGKGFPQFVQSLRGRLGMSQEQFSDYIGASGQCRVSQWEAGEVTPNRITVESLAEIYNKVSRSTASSLKGHVSQRPRSRAPRKENR
jgi:transcriptional regulator with XRE-family HTH domain